MDQGQGTLAIIAMVVMRKIEIVKNKVREV
jgi:hypothetical protein